MDQKPQYSEEQLKQIGQSLWALLGRVEVRGEEVDAFLVCRNVAAILASEGQVTPASGTEDPEAQAS